MRAKNACTTDKMTAVDGIEIKEVLTLTRLTKNRFDQKCQKTPL